MWEITAWTLSFILTSVCLTATVADITDCTSIIQLSDPHSCKKATKNWLKLHHCICSCTQAYLNNDGLVIDFSFCFMFLSCPFLNSLTFIVNVYNTSTMIDLVRSYARKINNSFTDRLLLIGSNVNRGKGYSFEVLTKCKMCDDSCSPIHLQDERAVLPVTILPVTESTPSSNTLLVYTVILPCVASISLIVIVIIYIRYKKDSLSSALVYDWVQNFNSGDRNV